MFRVLIVVFLIITAIGCSDNKKEYTAAMEKEALQTVVYYLESHRLPNENLVLFKSKASPQPDFSFLYTGGGRCIEFIVNCSGNSCSKLQKYPYDEHGEKCP